MNERDLRFIQRQETMNGKSLEEMCKDRKSILSHCYPPPLKYNLFSNKQYCSLDSLFLSRDQLKRVKLKSFTKNSKLKFSSNPSKQYTSIQLDDEETFPSNYLINIKTASQFNKDVSTLL